MKNCILFIALLLPLWASGEATVISSLSQINDLADGTEFVFEDSIPYEYHENEIVVHYVNGDYLYLFNDFTVVLVYGNTGQTYEMGNCIDNGWGGTKTTVDGAARVVNPTGFKVSTEDTWYNFVYYHNVDVTGRFNSVQENLSVHTKIRAIDVTITQPDANGYFTITGPSTEDGTVSIKARNIWNVSISTDVASVMDVEAMIATENGERILYPTTDIEPYERKLYLWEIPDDDYNEHLTQGGQVSVISRLYVGACVPEKKLIFATDNKCMRVNKYGSTGYDPNPQWAELDFSDNEELYNAVAKMATIYNVAGQVYDHGTNMRIVVNSTPIEVIDNPYYDGAIVLTYDLTAGKNLNDVRGNENLKVKAMFRLVDGVPVLAANEESTQTYRVRYDYAPELEGKYSDGETIETSAVAKLVSDKNFDLYLIDDSSSGVADLDADKTVKSVLYVNAMGQVSKTPHPGFNVVRTTYTDGTTTSLKVIR